MRDKNLTNLLNILEIKSPNSLYLKDFHIRTGLIHAFFRYYIYIHPNRSLRGVKRLRGQAQANPEIPRFARNRLRNPKDEIATPSGLVMTTFEDVKCRLFHALLNK
jgi:hypothetical protein